MTAKPADGAIAHTRHDGFDGELLGRRRRLKAHAACVGNATAGLWAVGTAGAILHKAP